MGRRKGLGPERSVLAVGHTLVHTSTDARTGASTGMAPNQRPGLCFSSLPAISLPGARPLLACCHHQLACSSGSCPAGAGPCQQGGVCSMPIGNVHVCNVHMCSAHAQCAYVQSAACTCSVLCLRPAHHVLLISSPSCSLKNKDKQEREGRSMAPSQATPAGLIHWKAKLAAAACSSTAWSQPETVERCQVILETI